MLCDYVTRGYGDYFPLTTAASVEVQRRSAWGGAAVVRPVQRGGGPGTLLMIGTFITSEGESLNNQ